MEYNKNNPNGVFVPFGHKIPLLWSGVRFYVYRARSSLARSEFLNFIITIFCGKCQYGRGKKMSSNNPSFGCSSFECKNIFVPCCRFPFMPVDWCDLGAHTCTNQCPYHSCTYCDYFNLVYNFCNLKGGENE